MRVSYTSPSTRGTSRRTRRLRTHRLLILTTFDLDEYVIEAPRAGASGFVRVVVRGKALKSTMSQYLVDRIERLKQIEAMTETEVSAVHGTGHPPCRIRRRRHRCRRRRPASPRR